MTHTIVLFVFGDVGDTLLTVPAIRAIRRAYPDAQLVLLSKAVPGQIVEDLGLADRTVVVQKHLFDRPLALLSPRSWVELAQLFRQLRGLRANTVVIFHHLVSRWGTAKFALLSLATGASLRVGLDNGRGWFLTRKVRDAGFGARHEAEYWLEVAAALGATGELVLEAPVADADRASVHMMLGKEGLADRRLLAIHAGSGWYGPGRRWPAPLFAATIELILREYDLTPVLVGTSEDSQAASQVADALGSSIASVVGRTTLGQLGALLERSTLVIGNDGGVMHLAAAVGARVVAVFGPSNDRAWRPLSGTVVSADVSCRPCFYRDYETGLRHGCATRECLALVTPRMVADAALQALGEEQIAV